LDECLEETHSCSADADCSNTPGSYDCTCSAGYTGSGFECKDIDDCAATPCKHGHCRDFGADLYMCTCAVGWGGQDCDQVVYKVTLTNGEHPASETDDAVYVRLHGAEGDTSQLTLSAIGLGRGESRVATLAAEHVGRLTGLTYWQSGTDEVQPVAVTVEVQDTVFEAWGAFDWARGADDKVRVTLDVVDDPSIVAYEVTVFGGPGAKDGTEEPVFVRIVGEFGSTGEVAVFPYGITRSTKHTATVRAKDVGALRSLAVSQGGQDGVRLVGALVTAGNTRYSVRNDAGTNQFQWSDLGGAGVDYALFRYDECRDRAYSTACEPSALTQDAVATASSSKGPGRMPENVMWNAGSLGWAPLLRQDEEWVQLDLGEEVWVTSFAVKAGNRNTDICPAGNSIFELQPPICCEYVRDYRVESMRDGDEFSFESLGVYSNGDCFRDVFVELDAPVLGRHFRLHVLNVAAAEWPSIKMEYFGWRAVKNSGPFTAADYGPAIVGREDIPLTPQAVTRACTCFKEQGPSGFAPGTGACSTMVPGVTACPVGDTWGAEYPVPSPFLPAEQEMDCSVAVRGCNNLGYGASFTLNAGSEAECLAKAKATFVACGNMKSTSTDAYSPVTATYGPTRTARTFPDQLVVTEASYGTSCGAERNNVISDVKKWCEGRLECGFVSSVNSFGFDPAEGCAKNFRMKYSCGEGLGAEEQTVVLDPAGAEGQTVSLQCLTSDARLKLADELRDVVEPAALQEIDESSAESEAPNGEDGALEASQADTVEMKDGRKEGMDSDVRGSRRSFIGR